MTITLDNIRKFKDWGMVLSPAKDKKPLTKWNGKYDSRGKKEYVWSADWTEDDLLKADRLAVFHEPEKRGVKGSNILTIDFDCFNHCSLLPSLLARKTAAVALEPHILNMK